MHSPPGHASGPKPSLKALVFQASWDVCTASHEPLMPMSNASTWRVEPMRVEVLNELEI